MYRVGDGNHPPIPDRLSEEGQDFLACCFVQDQNSRWTAHMLEDHPFVKVSFSFISISGVLSTCENSIDWTNAKTKQFILSCPHCFLFCFCFSYERIVFNVFKNKNYSKLTSQMAWLCINTRLSIRVFLGTTLVVLSLV